jgi:hypothetical protein
LALALGCCTLVVQLWFQCGFVCCANKCNTTSLSNKNNQTKPNQPTNKQTLTHARKHADKRACANALHTCVCVCHSSNARNTHAMNSQHMLHVQTNTNKHVVHFSDCNCSAVWFLCAVITQYGVCALRLQCHIMRSHCVRPLAVWCLCAVLTCGVCVRMRRCGRVGWARGCVRVRVFGRARACAFVCTIAQARMNATTVL